MAAVKAGEYLSVILTGTVQGTRQDSDGLKVNLRAPGFFIWFAAESRSVKFAGNTVVQRAWRLADAEYERRDGADPDWRQLARFVVFAMAMEFAACSDEAIMAKAFDLLQGASHA